MGCLGFRKRGWVGRLWEYVSNRNEDDYVEIYNLSISGGTTETILKRFEAESKIREADALIFQTGGNDSAYQSSPENLIVSLENFENNIREIVSRAKKITDKIIFMDLRNCDESKTTPVPWIDFYYTNENMQKYSKIMEKVCRDNDVLFMEISKLENSDFDDGLHPNEKGHGKIFDEVKFFLEKEGWI